VVEQVLDLSRIEQDQMAMTIESLDPASVIEECMTTFEIQAKQRGLALESMGLSSNELPMILADRMRLKQGLFNLLGNAVKYNTTGTRVGLHTGYDRAGFLRFEISDDGPGTPEARHAEVYEPFNHLGSEARGIDGTGIGLTISRKIVENMGGHIDFESAEGAGAKFWIDLPIAGPAREQIS
jgi:signal transduction histidine kinase